jgi:putative addiction module component (TIGR02574 family)
MDRGGSTVSDAVTQILAHLDRLSQQERADLAYVVLCSMEPEEEGVAKAWDAELSRRAADIRSGQAARKPAQRSFEELRENGP